MSDAMSLPASSSAVEAAIIMSTKMATVVASDSDKFSWPETEEDEEAEVGSPCDCLLMLLRRPPSLSSSSSYIVAAIAAAKIASVSGSEAPSTPPAIEEADGVKIGTREASYWALKGRPSRRKSWYARTMFGNWRWRGKNASPHA